MAQIKFTFYVEKKNLVTGASEWDPDGISPEVLLEEVTIVTKAKILKVEEMVKPLTIPQGCEDRSATISGVFTDSLVMSTYANARLDVVRDDRPDEALSRAIAVTSGNDLVPELSNRLWRINSFTWDRMANKLGQYHFSMQLGYIWIPALNEIQLFAGGVGTVKYDNVKFFYEKQGFASHYQIYDTTIHATCKDLNTAEFSTIYQELDVDDIIQIYSETYPTKPMFYGLVSEVKNSQNGTFKYNCIEIGDILNRKHCAKLGVGLFKSRIKIPNPYGVNRYFTISEMVKLIIQFYLDGPVFGYNPGYGVCTSPLVAVRDTLPGKSSKISPQILSGMSVGKALDTFLINQCGLYTWYNSLTGALEYGFVRNGITINPMSEYIEDSTKIPASTSDYNADYIILWNNSADQRAIAPESATAFATSKCIQYKLNSDLHDQQLADFAAQVFDATQRGRDTYKVTFQAGVCRFQDGDFFTGLGDETTTTPMPYRTGTDTEPETDPSDQVWQIKEMTITEQKTEVIVGSSFFSVFDIYQDALKRCDGVPATTENKEIKGYYTGIGSVGVI